MRPVLFSICLSVALLTGGAALAACERRAIAGPVDARIPARGIDQDLFSAALLAETNYLRCRHGRAPLRPSARLRDVAADHSRWMAANGQVAHSGRRSFADRLARTRLRRGRATENITDAYRYRLTARADGFLARDRGSCRFTYTNGRRVPRHSYATLARHIARILYESPAHRRNMLDRRVGHHAAGVALRRRGTYCGRFFVAQDFIE